MAPRLRRVNAKHAVYLSSPVCFLFFCGFLVFCFAFLIAHEEKQGGVTSKATAIKASAFVSYNFGRRLPYRYSAI